MKFISLKKKSTKNFTKVPKYSAKNGDQKSLSVWDFFIEKFFLKVDAPHLHPTLA